VLENGCPYEEEEILYGCAGNWNPPEMLRWAINEKKLRWDTDALGFAVASGKIGTIAWALRHGCPVDRDLVVLKLAESMQLQIIQFLTKELNLVFSESEISDFVENALMHDNLQILVFLRENGYRWHQILKDHSDPRIRQLDY
jgi:hypothetical protein